MERLRIILPEEIEREIKAPVSEQVRDEAGKIVERVRRDGLVAVRELASRFGECDPTDPIVLGRESMRQAYESLTDTDRQTLERVADRIRLFALTQRAAIHESSIEVPGGTAGHSIEPVHSAGCYAPGGRYPLPSSVLMTAITARAAGCERVVVVSPGRHPVMLAAAHIAAADEFLCIGGAHAIAALAYGFEAFQRCDVVVGPGNAWVTAAKQAVSGVVGIDMLAGPSELLILADESADVRLMAADLLAQAEHDPDAIPMLVTTCVEHEQSIQLEIQKQLETLPTAEIAEQSLRNGFVVCCETLDEAIRIVDIVGPEHLEVMTREAAEVAQRVHNAGGIFIGEQSAEVLGDYGIGPNHTLPTGGTSRFSAGLSVMNFLRLRTWIRIDDPLAAAPARQDAIEIAKMEGLMGHAQALLARERS